MSIFLQAVALVSDLPGSLVYYLIVLFILGFSAAIAGGQWRRERVIATGRLALAAASIFALHLLTFAVTLLAGVGLLDAAIVVPPLDRAVSALTIVLIIWAFAFPDPSRPADAAFGGATFLGLLALAISWGLWAQEVVQQNTPVYNGTVQETAWELAQMSLLAIGLGVLAARRKSEWPIGIALLVLLLAGHIIHYLFPLAENVPGAERLMEIVAMPMFAAMIYRRIHPVSWESLPLESSAESLEATWPRPAVRPPDETLAETAIPTSTPTTEARPPAWTLDPKAAVALASLNASAKPAEAAQVLTLALAHTFNADLCLLVTPPDSSGVASIACSYDLITEKFRSGATLLLTDMLTVDAVLHRRESARLTMEQHEAELRRLASAVGLKQGGPALIAPLAAEDGPLLGAIILLSPYAKRVWSEADQELLAAMAEPLAATLEAATRAARLDQEMAEKQAALEKAEADLRVEQSETQRLADELTEAQVAVKYATEQLRAQREVEARQLAFSDEVTTLRTQMQAAQQMAEEREQLEARIEAAERRAEEYQEQSDQLAAALERVRDEMDQLRAGRRTAAPAEAEALSLLQSELELAQRQLMDGQQREAELNAELERARLGAEAPTAASPDDAGRRQAELEAVQRQFAESREREIMLAADLDRVRAELFQLQAELRGDPDALTRAQVELEQAQREVEAGQQRTLELTAELERLRAERDQLSAEKHSAAPPEELARLQSELEQARHQAEASQQRETELEAEVERLRIGIDRLDAQTPKAPAAEAISRLQSELMLAQRQAEGRNRLLVELSEVKEKLQVFTAAEAQLREANELLHQQEDQLRRELELTRAELKRLTQITATFGPTPEAAVDKLAELEAALAAAQAERVKQMEARTAADEQLARKDRQLTKIQAALQAAQAQAADSHALAEHESLLAQAQADLAQARTQLNDLRLQLAEAEAALAVRPDPATHTALQEKLATSERQLAEVQTALKAARETAGQPPGDLPSSSLEVIASLTQDLRQPLSSIVGYSELLLGESVGILGALQKKFIERIQASSERMGALLDDLIRVTAIDSGPLKLLREKLDVMGVVEEAILNCGSQFREKGINLRLDFADDLPQVQADRDALRQIVMHLLNNAGSASTIDGEVMLSVKRESEQRAAGERADYIFISVRDSGGGIRPEDQPRVFSRVYRADAPLIAGLGDTGVGLSVAKALVEAHGGRIWLTSEMGTGSTFNLLLPVDMNPNGRPPSPNGSPL